MFNWDVERQEVEEGAEVRRSDAKNCPGGEPSSPPPRYVSARRMPQYFVQTLPTLLHPCLLCLQLALVSFPGETRQVPGLRRLLQGRPRSGHWPIAVFGGGSQHLLL